ncbi:hypothetical protein [Streptomyces aurantiacus]|nr:hypothetical protein [Streptomyces aurantiacus]
MVDPHPSPPSSQPSATVVDGCPGALANAVFHATGRRVRDLPITVEALL